MSDKKRNIALNELDAMFYSLECLGYPLVSKVHFVLAGGAVDTDVLQRTCAVMLDRFPTFAGLIRERATWLRWHLSWQCGGVDTAETVVKEIDCTDKPADKARQTLDACLHESVQGESSRNRRPFKLVLCHMPDKTQHVLLMVNHICADGYAFFWFVQEFFELYNHMFSGNADYGWTQPAPTAFPTSLLPGSVVKKVGALLAGLGIVLKRMWHSHRVKHANLINGSSSFSGSVRTLHRIINPGAADKYLAAARRCGTGLSELLIAAQIVALERYWAEQGKRCDDISIQVHHHLRVTPQQLRETGNRFSTQVIGTRPKERTDLVQLIHLVKYKLQQGRMEKLAEKTAGLLWIFRCGAARKWLHWWAPAVFNNPRVGDSLAVSNMAQIWMDKQGHHLVSHLGPAQVKDCYIYGSPIPSVGTFMVLYMVNEQLHLGFNYFDWALSDEQAQHYLDLTLRVLEEYGNT